ncbi:MAG: hypothetical protein ACK4M7_01095 [Burkholderiales bacterium]
MVSAAATLSNPWGKRSNKINTLECITKPNSSKDDKKFEVGKKFFEIKSVSDNESGDEIDRGDEGKLKLKELKEEISALTFAELDRELGQAIDQFSEIPEQQKEPVLRHLFQFLAPDDINNLAQASRKVFTFVQKQENVDKVLNKLYNNLELLADKRIREKALSYLKQVGTVEFDKRTIAVALKICLHRDEKFFFDYHMRELKRDDVKVEHINLRYDGWFILGFLENEGITYISKDKTEAKIRPLRSFTCITPKNFFYGVKLEEMREYLDKRGVLYTAPPSNQNNLTRTRRACVLF